MATIPVTAAVAAGPRDAFAHRDFRVFWIAALVSNIGSWMQNLAVPYVIFEATGSVTWVGFAAVVSLLPSVPMSPLGGIVADRYPRRKVLFVTQILMALVALALWFEWRAGWRNPWALMVPVAAASLVSGINMPSWQAFIYDLVPARLLAPSVALNSAQFHLSRAIGPLLAGLVLDNFGASWTFLINAMSFFAVIGAVFVLRPVVAPRPRVSGGVWRQTLDAGRYMLGEPTLRWSFTVVAAMAFFGHAVLTLVTPIAREVFHQGASGIGLLTAGFGIGAGLGVLVLARVNQRMERGRVVQTGLALYGLLVLLLGSARTLPMMFVIMIPFGTVYLMIIATCNTTLQMTTTEAMRGRVLAFYFIAFGVFYPLGAQLQSFVADAIGLRTTIAIFGASLTVLAWVWRRGDRVALAMRAERVERVEPRTVS